LQIGFALRLLATVGKRETLMLVRPLDILFALKAINLAAGLKNNDRAIAATLLDHFNRETRQCDPGLERIADLVSVSTRTVMRAMPRIEAAGLFRKIRHGGHLNRNSYEPNWQRFHEIEAAWKARKEENSRRGRLTDVSPATRQPCHLGGDNPVTQTCRSNLSKETCQKRLSNKEKGEFIERRFSLNSSDALVARTEPARVSAERRWTTDLHREFASLPLTYGEIIEAIDPAMQEAATDAEMRLRGGGLAYIARKLKLGDVL